jgi:diguanylate cyclase (GGDEF)-like protein
MVKAIALLVTLFVGYLGTVILGWGTAADVLSPMNALASGGIMFFAYRKTDPQSKTRITFLIYSIACLAWAAADAAWTGISLYGLDPSSSIINNSIYIMTNIFLLTALLIFAVLQFSNWNPFLLMIDSMIIAIMALNTVWIILLHKDAAILIHMLRTDFVGVFSIFTDVAILIGVTIWFVSVHTKMAPLYMWMFSFGAGVFTIADLMYYYSCFESIYISNTMIDLLYALALDIIALGGIWRVYQCNSAYDVVRVTNTDTKDKWYLLFLFPIVVLFLKESGLVPVDANAGDIAFLASMAYIYKGARRFVQFSIENEKLLHNEKETNRILEQRVEDQVRELSFLARQDTLTMLYNRRYFFSCLEEKIKRLQPEETLTLLLIDLDRFKLINDNYGHDIGDKLLIELSLRMLSWNESRSTFARLGGDEFAVMLAGHIGKAEIEDCCAEIIEFCNRPIQIEHEMFRITVSMGVAMYSPEADDGPTLLKHAEIAMYHAKSQGYNKFQYFDPLLSESLSKSREIEFLLRRSDVGKDFELFFQPQFALPGKELVGAEALLRWKDPTHGYIPPNVFIPVAEEIDYIFVLGKWVINETIRHAMKWNAMVSAPLKISFNISPKQLNDEDFIGYLRSLIGNTGIDPTWIDAEITESIMIEDEIKAGELFTLFSSLGITVSLDDFGSGYSSLGYLSKYSFNKIKIDKLLIDQVGQGNISGLNVVTAAINMGKAVGLKTIAEGVESQEQLDILIEMGCDQVQGYLLGRPVPAQVFEELYLKTI